MNVFFDGFKAFNQLVFDLYILVIILIQSNLLSAANIKVKFNFNFLIVLFTVSV